MVAMIRLSSRRRAGALPRARCAILAPYEALGGTEKAWTPECPAASRKLTRAAGVKRFMRSLAVKPSLMGVNAHARPRRTRASGGMLNIVARARPWDGTASDRR